MIYWFTGAPGHGKTFLSEQLLEFLKTERRNWRRDVHYIDAETLEETSPYFGHLDEEDPNVVRNAQLIASFISNTDGDVIVSLISPRLDLREEFKNMMDDKIVEIYVYNTDGRKIKHNHIEWYEEPKENFLGIDTTKKEPIDAYTELIHKLKNNDIL